MPYRIYNLDVLKDRLKHWRYRRGEIEELIVLLAKNNGFDDLDLVVDDNNQLKYKYILNNKGRRIANIWALLNSEEPIETKGYFFEETDL